MIVGTSGLRTTAERSLQMGKVKGRGNKSTELRLARLLRKEGLAGWRRHARIRGTPDFSFWKWKTAIFVDGCFWHGCPRCYSTPRQNAGYWKSKIVGNRTRDRRVNRALKHKGWKVLRLWECVLEKSPESVLRRIRIELAK